LATPQYLLKQMLKRAKL